MKFSIVVDNYNYEQYVALAIESALAQTSADVEVIVVDDGSTDGSRAAIDAYADRVKVIYKDNGGQNTAFNAAFEQVTGDALMFLDADDLADADLAQRVVKAFESDPSVSRVQWGLRIIDADGVVTGDVQPKPAVMPSGDLRQHIVRFRTHVWPATSGNAYRTEVLRKLMPIPSNYRLGVDLYFAETTALYGPIISLPNPGGSYRVHGSNNWAGSSLNLANLHQRIDWTVRTHEHVKRIGRELGMQVPERAEDALDIAFISQRLASLRLDKGAHPLPNDRRFALTVRGVQAIVRHPFHTKKHKLKRLVWLLGVGLGPAPLAKNFIRRFYFK